jgi:hypothetical protein
MFYLGSVWALTGRRFDRRAVASVVLAVAAIAVTQVLQARTMTFAFLPIVLGLVAALTLGFYSAATDEKWSFEPWTMTLVVEVVTAIGVTIFVAIKKSDLVVSLPTFGYLAIIGGVSNGLGFALFLASNRLSAELGGQWKGTWLMTMCLVPVIQVIFLPIMGMEVSPLNWVGVGLVSLALIFYRFGGKKAEAA